MIIKTLSVWLLLMVVAVLNGGAREALIRPRLGERAGHVLSTLVLCALIFLVAWLSIGWIGPTSTWAAVWIGMTWVALTLAFEFLAGHYLFGNSWEKILADYNLLRGRIWPLVLIATLLAPVWACWLRYVV